MKRKLDNPDPMPADRHTHDSTAARAAEMLRRFGIRPSQLRLTVLEHLMEHPDHATADELIEALSDKLQSISKTTVSNTIRLFADSGAIQALSVGLEPEHYDATGEPHAHFFCTKCRKMHDVPITSETWTQLSTAAPEESHEIQVFYKGICKDCASEYDR